MFTQQLAIDKATSFTKEILSNGLKLRKAILFGSYANQTQHEFSDIDLCLIADEFTGFGYEDVDYFVRIINKKEFLLIEPKTYSTANYLNGDPFLNSEVNRTGIVIFDNLTNA